MGQWWDGDCYASTVDFVQKNSNAPELHWQCGGVAGPPRVAYGYEAWYSDGPLRLSLREDLLGIYTVQCGTNSSQWLCEGCKFILCQFFEKVLRSSSTLLV